MEKVTVEDIESRAPGGSEIDRRSLAGPLGAENAALNRFVLDPGEAFTDVVHTHFDQEEIFYVLEGEATFETQPKPTADGETVTVGPREAIRFAPGEYQQGRNESDEQVVALAIGAPKESTKGRLVQPCPACDSPTLDVVVTEEGMMLECSECGEQLQPEM
jgi:mannose-6-phosphate isomerase-like protein (cupin superfamily)